MHELLALCSVALNLAAGLLFVATGWIKLAEGDAFVGVVVNYRILPDGVSQLFARLLPPLECILGAALIATPGRPEAALAAAGLLCLFALAMGINLVRGRTEIGCGCFRSESGDQIRWRMVVSNLALAGLLAFEAATQARPLGWSEWTNGVLAGLVVFCAATSLSLLNRIQRLRHEVSR